MVLAKVMTASIGGEHDINGPSSHAYVALLSSPQPADWEEVGSVAAVLDVQSGMYLADLTTARSSNHLRAVDLTGREQHFLPRRPPTRS